MTSVSKCLETLLQWSLLVILGCSISLSVSTISQWFFPALDAHEPTQCPCNPALFLPSNGYPTACQWRCNSSAHVHSPDFLRSDRTLTAYILVCLAHSVPFLSKVVLERKRKSHRTEARFRKGELLASTPSALLSINKQKDQDRQSRQSSKIFRHTDKSYSNVHEGSSTHSIGQL